MNSGNYFSPYPFSILKNTSTVGMPAFERVPLFTPAYQHDPLGVSVADLDGDGKLDLLIANGDGANFGFRTTCRNTGTGNSISFEIKETALPKIIHTGMAGDIDGDGKPDMIVSYAYDSAVGVARNTSTPGNISFADDFRYQSRLSTFGLNAVDLDGDGKQDLVASGYNALGFSVLLNRGGERPSITAVGPTSFCRGDSVLLVSSLPYSNQWYENAVVIPGANNDSLMVRNGGSYTVATHTSAPSDSLLVVAHPVPDKPSISWSATDGLVSSAGIGNQWYTDSPTTAISGAIEHIYKPATEGYYLVRVTQDGCVSPFSDHYHYLFSGPTGTTSNGNPVKVTPNPTMDFITVTIQADTADIYTAQLYYLSGRLVLTVSQIVSGDRIDLSRLPAGMYVLKVTGSSGRWKSMVSVIKR